MADAAPAVSGREIAVANQHPRLRVDARAVIRAIRALDAVHGTLATSASVLGSGGELSIVFMTDAALARLHDEFLDDPTITDVITFEGDPALGTAGEICVSVDAAVRHVSETGRRSARIDPVAFAREVTLYVVHGWLHLAGYDDLQPAKKRIMRRAEKRALALLDRHDAVPAFAWRRR